MNIDDTRARSRKSLIRYRAAWVELAGHLHDIALGGDYKDWGFETFDGYCRAELGLKRSEVKRLLVAYNRLKKDDPEWLAQIEDGDAENSGRICPTPETLELLDKAERKSSDSADADDGDCEQLYQTIGETKTAAYGPASREVRPDADLRRQLRAALRPPKKDPGDDAARRLSVVRAARRLKQEAAGNDIVPDEIQTALLPMLDRIVELHPDAKG